VTHIIRAQSSAASRTKALKLIRDLLNYHDIYIANIKDIAAYIALLLDEVWKSIEDTSLAWEKRDYWVKADRFRQEWNWIKVMKDQLIQALLEENFAGVEKTIKQIHQKLGEDHQDSPRKRKINTAGSWERFKQIYSK